MNASGSGERREFYRLRYPDAERPSLFFDNMEFEVAELSESGMRLVMNRFPLGLEREVHGWIRFKDGEAVVVQGKVLRFLGEEAVIRLEIGVSLKRMLAEQRRLIKLYPILFDRHQFETHED